MDPLPLEKKARVKTKIPPARPFRRWDEIRLKCEKDLRHEPPRARQRLTTTETIRCRKKCRLIGNSQHIRSVTAAPLRRNANLNPFFRCLPCVYLMQCASDALPGLEMNRLLVAIVANGSLGLTGRFDTRSVSRPNDDDVKSPLLLHAGKRPRSVSNRQHRGFILPAYWNRGERPLFVIVSVALVFVDRERSIGAGVDSQFNHVRGLLRRVLQIGSERQ